MDEHKRDPFAHQPMMNRVMQENVTLREGFENRLKDVEKRTGLLEIFKAQAMIIGSGAIFVLGAVTIAVVGRLVGLIR